MYMQRLMRWSALAAVLSAVLDSIAVLLMPSLFQPYAVQSSLWAPILTLDVLAYLLALLALTGLHIRQAERSGTLGLIGFILASFSTVLFVAVHLIQAYALPVLASQPGAPSTAFDLLGPTGPLAKFFPIFMLTLLLFDLGFVLFSLSIVRAGVLPRWAGVVMLMGTVLANAEIAGPLGEIVAKLGPLAINIAFIGSAYALWHGRSQPSMGARSAASIEPAR